MAENLVKVVLDTNIIVSAIGFGGKPQQVLIGVLQEKIKAVTSSILLAELEEVLTKKLPLSKEDILLTLEEIKNVFIVVQPKKTVNAVRDEEDNRVLEAALEGGCSYIITGDKELLQLGKWKKISILTADQFLGIKNIF